MYYESVPPFQSWFVIRVSGEWTLTLWQKMRTLRVILLIFFCSSIAGYAEKSGDDALKWNKWSKVGLDKALADGESVLVQFSAEWCLTCVLNEKRCFQNEDVKSFLRSRKVVLLKADLTNQNDIATKALEKMGRSNVPTYAFYRPDKKDVVIFPVLLEPKTFLESLGNLLQDNILKKPQ